MLNKQTNPVSLVTNREKQLETFSLNKKEKKKLILV